MSSFKTSYLGIIAQLVAELAKNITHKQLSAEHYISKLEISVRLESKNREQAISVFKEKISEPKNLEKILELAKTIVHRKPDSALAIVDSLYRVFTEDKSILPKIEADIEKTAITLSISQKETNKISNSYLRRKKRLTPVCEISYYKTLNCKGAESFDEIKKKYHQLAIQYHPDTREFLNMSEDSADSKFQEIKEAYFKIKNAFTALEKENLHKS